MDTSTTSSTTSSCNSVTVCHQPQGVQQQLPGVYDLHFAELYTEVLEVCQPFYEIPSGSAASTPLSLSPRLEDGLRERNTGNPQDSSMSDSSTTAILTGKGEMEIRSSLALLRVK